MEAPPAAGQPQATHSTGGVHMNMGKVHMNIIRVGKILKHAQSTVNNTEHPFSKPIYPPKGQHHMVHHYNKMSLHIKA